MCYYLIICLFIDSSSFGFLDLHILTHACILNFTMNLWKSSMTWYSVERTLVEGRKYPSTEKLGLGNREVFFFFCQQQTVVVGVCSFRRGRDVYVAVNGWNTRPQIEHPVSLENRQWNTVEVSSLCFLRHLDDVLYLKLNGVTNAAWQSLSLRCVYYINCRSIPAVTYFPWLLHKYCGV